MILESLGGRVCKRVSAVLKTERPEHRPDDEPKGPSKGQVCHDSWGSGLLLLLEGFSSGELDAQRKGRTTAVDTKNDRGCWLYSVPYPTSFAWQTQLK